MSTGIHRGWVQVGQEELRRSWGWFVGLGVLLLIIGVIALGAAVLTTLVSVELFGWLLVVSGILTAAHAFWRRRWGGFFVELLIGFLYLIVGLMIAANPGESAVALTLLIALFLMAGGVLRIVAALALGFHHSGWVLLNGLISLILGVMIWRQWPVSGLWVIGVFVGIDLIFYGWSLIMLGLAARRLPA